MYIILLLLVSTSSAQFIDEMQTMEMDCLREDRFPCHSGGCVPTSDFCDGIVNCEDGSDENFCPEHLADVEVCNETHQFLCADGKRCLPVQWVCNTEQDCVDGSDEANCTVTEPVVDANATCKGFQCGEKCISWLWVCDGVYDCADKSDENNITLCVHLGVSGKEVSFERCISAPESYYMCTDKSYCLPAGSMCDGLLDCRDGSDEGPFCKNWETMCSTHNCSTTSNSFNVTCHPDRTGPVCLCSDSNFKFNTSTARCEEIDGCASERPRCSQKCISDGRYTKCECVEGYVSGISGSYCYARDSEAILFFSTKNEIMFFKLKSLQFVSLVTGVKQAHGVAYDGNYVYWVEMAKGHQSIMRAHLEDMENTKTVLLGLGLEEPGDIALDLLGGNLYFTDSIRGSIFACKLDASACLTIKTEAKHPRFITLDPKKGKMYWADYIDGQSMIMSAQMDGSNAVPLTKEVHTVATGLALDSPNDRLYFVDRNVKVVILTTKVVYTLFEEKYHHPYSIGVFENSVFWSDWTSTTLMTADKFHALRDNRHVLLPLNTSVFGLHIFHPVLSRSAHNPCASLRCSHICLVTSETTSVCTCPDSMTLEGNNCVPSPSYRPEYVVAGGGQLLARVEYSSLRGADARATRFAGVGRIQAMAYDSYRDTLYLYDGQYRTISYVNMSDFTSGISHTIVHTGLDNVVDMDYEPQSGALLTLDAGRRALEALGPRGARALLYHFPHTEIPISFCVLPDYGRILVAVIEAESRNIHIISIGLDGEDRRPVLTNYLKGPHVRLRYSQYTDTVYISDEGNAVIDYMHPEGTGREKFLGLPSTVTSLALTDSLAFWAARRTQRLFWAELHAAHQTVRRIDLTMFPNSTQLVLASAGARSPPPRGCARPCALCVHPPAGPSAPRPLASKCLCPYGSVYKEGKCTEVVICRGHEMYCHNSNVCIDLEKYCDGVKDCQYGEDEDSCEDPALPPPTSSCSRSEFECGAGAGAGGGGGGGAGAGGRVCVGRALLCDRRADCPDGGDEAAHVCAAVLCFDTEFMCASGSCIPMTWKCDGVSDCNDATDEVGCENATCEAGFFQCRNRECIEVKRRCDGKQDCFDFSDEEDCEETVYLEEDPVPDCSENEFVCETNKSICYPFTARCNGKLDCPGGTDEMGCESFCGRLGLFQCEYFKLACTERARVCDGRRDCADGSDEAPGACALTWVMGRASPPPPPPPPCVPGARACHNLTHCDGGDDGPRCEPCAAEPCAHRCTAAGARYVCSCAPGYALRADGVSCKALHGNMSVWFVSGGAVRSVSAAGLGAAEYADPAAPAFTDLDVDVRRNKLYVTSADSEKLIEVNGTRDVVAVTNVGRPTRVAVEWVSGNVYFVDSSPAARLRVCSVPRRRCAMLQRLAAGATVTSLIVDPLSRLMFYCVSHASESVIWSATLSGRHASDVARVGNCTGLASDASRRRLYVAEAAPPAIWTMDYDGGNLKKIISEQPYLEAPHTLAIFEDHIYYLVANSLRLARCSLHGVTRCETYIYRMFDANTFVLRHDAVQPEMANDCEGVVCANVCVLDSEGYQCLCSDGGFAVDGACPAAGKDELPLFNGWSSLQYAQAHRASFSVIAAVLALLVAYLAGFVYYHFVYKPRKNRARAYTEVRYQNNPAMTTELSYTPSIDMVTDGNISHEFVNPLQYIRNAWADHSFDTKKPIGTAGLTIDLSQSPQNCSATESDLDDKELLKSEQSILF